MLFLSQTVLAQTADSTQQEVPKSFFKKWRLAGLSFSTSYLFAKPKKDWFPVYGATTKTPETTAKYNADIDSLNTFPFQQSLTDNSNHFLRLNLNFKPSSLNRKKLLSYTEFSLGLLYNVQEATIQRLGHRDFNDSNYRSYYLNGTIATQNIGVDLFYTIQTPGFFNTLALYTGVGIYGGATLQSNIALNGGVAKYFSRGGYLDSTVSPNNRQDGFYNSSMVLGLSIPFGLKIRISNRCNVSLEYIYNSHTTLFRNGFQKTQGFDGLSVGVRYKFGEKSMLQKNENSSPTPPQPFY